MTRCWSFGLPFRMFVEQALTEATVAAVMQQHFPQVAAWLAENVSFSYHWHEEYLRDGKPYIAHFFVVIPTREHAALFKLFWADWLNGECDFLR